MKNIAEFIFSKPDAQRELFSAMNEILLGYPGMRSAIRYGIPFYGMNKWICYLNPQKGGGLELCFWNGLKLKDDSGLLQIKDRKQIAGITLHHIDNLPLEVIDGLVQQAIEMDKRETKLKR